MLFILFHLGHDRYALEAAQIVEVLPLVDIRPIPRAPPGVAGVFNYHGAPVPAIDLNQLTLNKPARTSLGTRIIIVHYPNTTGAKRLLGLIAERATETMQRDPGEFSNTGLCNDNAPYLGPVVFDPRGLIQRIDVHTLLPASVRDALFRQAEEV